MKLSFIILVIMTVLNCVAFIAKDMIFLGLSFVVLIAYSWALLIELELKYREMWAKKEKRLREQYLEDFYDYVKEKHKERGGSDSKGYR